MELRGKVGLVTGAGRRLGRAMAQALAERGMTVALHYHQSEAGARELAGQIEAAGGRAACFQADLTDAHAAESLPRTVAARLGGLDVLVNSAAVMQHLSLEETTPEQWDAILGLNLRSVFFCTRGAVAALRQSRGKVVNLVDLAGLEPWPGFADGMGRKAGPGLEAGQVSQVDHLASALPECRSRSAGTEEYGAQVEAENRIPLLRGGLFQIGRAHV